MHIRLFTVLGLGVLYLVSNPARAQLAEPPGTGSINAPAPAPAVPAVDQDQTVKLLITAKGSGILIRKAEIKIGKKTVFSDKSGVALITIPSTGDGVVVVTRVSYERLEIPFATLRPPGQYTVRLLPGTPDDNVIVVQGQRDNAVSRTTVSIEEAAKVAPGGDPAQVVKLLPGVQSGGGRGGGGSDVIVQGSGPHDSRYFIDDLGTPFIFHGIADLSVIPGDMMRSVDFESAGFGVEYGDATGGIITIHTKEEIPERSKTVFVLNIPFYSGIYYTTPLSDSSALTVGIRRSYIDVFLQAFLNRRANNSKDKSTRITLSPYFSDAQVQYLTKSDAGHDKVTLLSAYDGVKAVVPSSFGSDQSGLASINFYTEFADIGWERERHLDANWKIRTTPQVYYYKTSATFGAAMDGNQTVEMVRMPTHLTRRLSKDENLYFGIDPNVVVASTRLTAPQFQSSDPTFDMEDAPTVTSVETDKYAGAAAWAAIDVKLGATTFTPGLRTFYDGETKKVGADPRLRARHVLSEQNTIKAAVGQYSENPAAMAASSQRGNPHLGFITCDHYLLGLETIWNEAWYTDISVYYKYAYDLVKSDTATIYANKGFMRSQGFETLIRRNLTGRLFGWLSYTYSKTQDKADSSSAWRTAQYDQTHVLTLVGDYKFTGTWDVGGRYEYHTGGTYNTVEAAVFNANLDKYESRPTYADVNNGRLSPYNTLTVYFNHDFLYDAWKLALRFGMEQYWFRPQIGEISYNYNYTKTVSATNLTNVPFIELKGEL